MTNIKRDAHGNPVTTERCEFQAAISTRALSGGIVGYRVGAYKESSTKVTALLRRRPAHKMPVAGWYRSYFDSQVLERGIKRALNPAESEHLSLETRTRIAQASWTNNPERIALDECQMLVEISLHERRPK